MTLSYQPTTLGGAVAQGGGCVERIG